MTLRFGIDRLLADPVLRKPLEGRRVALLAHPASVTADLTHSLDALVAAGVNLTAIFGPQHGVRGDLQDNMMESPDFTDPVYDRSEEHPSELQSLMRTSYSVFCLKQKQITT